MEFDNITLTDEFKDINNNESKRLKCKLNILYALFLLFLLGFIIISILFYFQSKQINILNNQIEDITNQFDGDYLKNKTSYLSMLNTKINKAETKLLEKDKEIQSIQTNLQQKDEETKIIHKNINNLNELMNEDIDNIEKNLAQKEEEIELLKKYSNDLNDSNKIINNNINTIENELKQKSKEIEIFSNNYSTLNDKINNNIEIRVNKNSDDIQDIKNLESNLALLVDFKVKVRIKALAFIDDQQLQICSHKPFDSDIIDESRTRLNAFKWGYAGCVWIMHQNGKFFEFFLTDSTYGMNDWKMQINNNDVYCTNIEIGSIFILENGSLNKYYKIKNNETGQYLFINQNKERDESSYYIELTTNKDLATDFLIEIYHEE